MSLSAIFLLILVVSAGICSFIFLNLNKDLIYLDLLFFEIDMSIGHTILGTFLIGIIVTIMLETIFFSLKRKNKDE